MSQTDGIKVKVVTIDPALATKLLSRNTRNRGVSTNRVDQYAADMRRGNWVVNGEAIKIADDGTILDGQHRLLAILEADTPVETLLIVGLPAEAQETMDQGRNRTLYEALKLRGEGEYTALAAALKVVTLYERDGVPFVGVLKAAPSNHECFRTLDRNPGVRESVALAAKHKVRWLSYSTLAGLHYLFAIVDQDDAEDFVVKLTRGAELPAASPIYLLRERLLRAHTEKHQALSPKAKMALVIRTWNAYRRGEDLVRMTWTGGRDPDRFPHIEGLAERADLGDDERVAA